VLTKESSVESTEAEPVRFTHKRKSQLKLYRPGYVAESREEETNGMGGRRPAEASRICLGAEPRAVARQDGLGRMS
jgi:hypothetical protein